MVFSTFLVNVNKDYLKFAIVVEYSIADDATFGLFLL